MLYVCCHLPQRPPEMASPPQTLAYESSNTQRWTYLPRRQSGPFRSTARKGLYLGTRSGINGETSFLKKYHLGFQWVSTSQLAFFFLFFFSFANESLFSPGCPPTPCEAEKDLERLQGSAYHFLLNINLNFLTVFSQVPSVTSHWASGGWGGAPATRLGGTEGPDVTWSRLVNN